VIGQIWLFLTNVFWINWQLWLLSATSVWQLGKLQITKVQLKYLDGNSAKNCCRSKSTKCIYQKMKPKFVHSEPRSLSLPQYTHHSVRGHEVQLAKYPDAFPMRQQTMPQSNSWHRDYHNMCPPIPVAKMVMETPLDPVEGFRAPILPDGSRSWPIITGPPLMYPYNQHQTASGWHVVKPSVSKAPKIRILKPNKKKTFTTATQVRTKDFNSNTLVVAPPPVVQQGRRKAGRPRKQILLPINNLHYDMEIITYPNEERGHLQAEWDTNAQHLQQEEQELKVTAPTQQKEKGTEAHVFQPEPLETPLLHQDGLTGASKNLLQDTTVEPATQAEWWTDSPVEVTIAIEDKELMLHKNNMKELNELLAMDALVETPPSVPCEQSHLRREEEIEGEDFFTILSLPESMSAPNYLIEDYGHNFDLLNDNIATF
jgi:hypothetical protein